MSPEAQRIAIAEACGWKIENYGPTGYETLYWRLRKPDGVIRFDGATGEAWCRAVFPSMMPDYLNDLNAMHEAETWLSWPQCNQYNECLMDLIGNGVPPHAVSGYVFFATAEQRAEAFLRTKGLWVEATAATPSPQCAA